jgi:cell shape-determining protein MreD
MSSQNNKIHNLVLLKFFGDSQVGVPRIVILVIVYIIYYKEENDDSS